MPLAVVSRRRHARVRGALPLLVIHLVRDSGPALGSLPPGRMTLSPWSFPDERMTIFRILVALRTRDPNRALACAAAWDPGSVPPRRHVIAAWAQIRVGTAIAQLCADELDWSGGRPLSSGRQIISVPTTLTTSEYKVAAATARPWRSFRRAGQRAAAPDWLR